MKEEQVREWIQDSLDWMSPQTEIQQLTRDPDKDQWAAEINAPTSTGVYTAHLTVRFYGNDPDSTMTYLEVSHASGEGTQPC